MARTKAAAPESVARFVANNADDVLLALFRHEQMKKERKKHAARIPDSIANSYFFSNPYGLDFHSWMGAHGITPQEDMDDVPTETMPESEEDEPPYDSETEAGYMPNAPEESAEPTVSPASPVPLPKGRHKKEASLLHAIAHQTLLERGLIKKTAAPSDPIRQKVAEYLRRKAAAEDAIPGGKAQGEPDSKYDPHQLEMGQEIEREHSSDPGIERDIAKDHLEEFPDYYSALKQMEQHLKEGEEKKKKDALSKLPRYLAAGAGASSAGTGMGKAFLNEIGGGGKLRNMAKVLKHVKGMPAKGHGGILLKGLMSGAMGAGAGLGMGKLVERKIRHQLHGRKVAAMKFGLDASELLGQDEQRKDDLHQQTIRHNEENHNIELQKGQLELQQAQETFQMKQQQQAQKNQEQQAQQQMAVQMQQQQQQQQRMQYMANMSGGGQQQPQQGQMQQQPQQGMQAPR
jgi:hypothetical protein